MHFNVAQLLKEPIGATRRYELTEEIRNLDPELTVLGPLVGQLELMRTHSGLLMWGQLSTAVQVSCGRCLEPLAQTVRFPIEESFRPVVEVATGHIVQPEEFEGEEEDLEDDALIISEHHLLDISEVVRQNIWLAIPAYPTCNWAGSEECPNFTAYKREMGDVRLLQAGSQPTTEDDAAIDPRWTALLALRGGTESQSSARGGQRESNHEKPVGASKKPSKNVKRK